jgi:hypothetical protein
MSHPKPRKIVEISFDAESTAQFPNLSASKTTPKHSTKTTSYNKTPTVTKSPTSSHSDSASAVTRADLETLAEDLGKMIRSEVKSIVTSGSSDVTMITLLKDEPNASRRQMQQQLEMMQTQFNTFQNMLTILQPLLNSPALLNQTVTDAPQNNPQLTSDNKTSNSDYSLAQIDTPMQTLEITTLPRLDCLCHVHMNETDPNDTEHNRPGPSGATPSPK